MPKNHVIYGVMVVLIHGYQCQSGTGKAVNAYDQGNINIQEVISEMQLEILSLKSAQASTATTLKHLQTEVDKKLCPHDTQSLKNRLKALILANGEEAMDQIKSSQNCTHKTSMDDNIMQQGLSSEGKDLEQQEKWSKGKEQHQRSVSSLDRDIMQHIQSLESKVKKEKKADPIFEYISEQIEVDRQNITLIKDQIKNQHKSITSIQAKLQKVWDMTNSVTSQSANVKANTNRITDLETKLAQQTQISPINGQSPQRKVAFKVSLSTPTATSPGQRLAYNHIEINQNSNYNNQTGVFTCDVPGTYIFTQSLKVSQINKMVMTTINKKGQIMAWNTASYDHHVDTGTAVSLVHLEAGEPVWTDVFYNTAGVVLDIHTTFSGYLLYAD